MCRLYCRHLHSKIPHLTAMYSLRRERSLSPIGWRIQRRGTCSLVRRPRPFAGGSFPPGPLASADGISYGQQLMPLLKKEDLLMITADHGNDPTYKGTDHTREQVPLLLYSPSDQGSGPLPTQDTFAVIGATIADNFGVQMPANTIGTSLLPLL